MSARPSAGNHVFRVVKGIFNFHWTQGLYLICPDLSLREGKLHATVHHLFDRYTIDSSAREFLWLPQKAAQFTCPTQSLFTPPVNSHSRVPTAICQRSNKDPWDHCSVSADRHDCSVSNRQLFISPICPLKPRKLCCNGSQ